MSSPSRTSRASELLAAEHFGREINLFHIMHELTNLQDFGRGGFARVSPQY